MTSRTAFASRVAPLAARYLVPLGLTALCLYLVVRQIGPIDAGAVWRQMQGQGAHAWMGAIAATVISFWSLGRYDAIAHRHLGTDIRARSASRAGVCAIAFSQTVGFGLLTGSFARWRMLRGLSPATAAKLTGFVAVTFLGALGFVVSLVWLVIPLVCGFAPLASAGLVLSLGLVALAFLRPVARFGALRLPLPSLPAIAAMGLWAIVDTFAACIALYFLIPDHVPLVLSTLLPAFLIALGVALVSGTPAGVGPFELTLLMLLPSVPADSLVAGILAFRIVYYLAPALIAGAVLLFIVPLRTSVRHVEAAAPTGPFPGDLARAETQVIRQNGGRVVGDHVSRIAVVSLPQVAVGLFDPVGGDPGHAIRRVIDTARRENRVACLYKCSGQTAARARRDGWLPVRIAREALLFPARFSLDTPARRQLRRKIRQADKAGIRIERAGPVQPVAEMTRVDAAWQVRQGRARGTTMGRYDPYYVACQIVFLAWKDDELIGFASFHESPREWCLDLMRTTDSAPDGTMHALINAALAEAASAEIPALSLAAVPDLPLRGMQETGLVRFKRAFAPVWKPMYLCAPDPTSLVLAAADIARAVHWPEALAPAVDTLAPDPAPRKFGFALLRRS